MALSTQPYKGARDFFPEDKRVQDYMFNKMRTVVKRYGYAEYDAPILEPLDLYRAKTGDEIVNEQVYSFTDRGGREVAIRPEMTPTVSRMVASKRQELAYPLRWFSIPNLWRYERPQRGRLREHWQLNVDIFGEAGLPADHEVVMVASDILKEFGATQDMFVIKLNSRKLVDSLFGDYLGLDEEASHKLAKLVDRMHKMEKQKFDDALASIVEEFCEPDKVHSLLEVKDLNELERLIGAHSSLTSLHDHIKLLNKTGITNVDFDITLMRGFDYYTDIVFEVNDTNPENNRAMFGGGRYDGLVGLFGVEPVPTVGFGMGDVTLANFLESHKLMPQLKNETDLIIITVGDVYAETGKIADRLRGGGLNVAIDATVRKLDKKIKNASKTGINYVLFVGTNEIEADQYMLKNIESGQESKVSPEQAIELILTQN